VTKFPDPPARGQLFARLVAERKILPAGTLLWRIYRRAGRHPTDWNEFRHWGPAAGCRFDHQLEPPAEQSRGILYAALRVPTCFAEVFQETRTIELSRARPWLAGFELAADVALLDLTGKWPTRAGASMGLSSGRRDRARAWSRRIYEDYPDVAGLFYPSSMDANRPTAALYERARGALPARPLFHRALADPALLGVVAGAAASFNYLVEP
jgi:hypothetical protein